MLAVDVAIRRPDGRSLDGVGTVVVERAAGSRKARLFPRFSRRPFAHESVYFAEEATLALRPTTEELARHILKRVFEHTEGRLEWRTLPAGNAVEAAVGLAEDRGWLLVDGSRGVYLTEEGRTLVRKGLS